jgi:hypothetical protein
MNGLQIVSNGYVVGCKVVVVLCVKFTDLGFAFDASYSVHVFLHFLLTCRATTLLLNNE